MCLGVFVTYVLEHSPVDCDRRYRCCDLRLRHSAPADYLAFAARPMTAFCRHDPRKEGAVRSASIACGSGENQLFSSRSRISPASVGFALRLLNFITSVIITIHLTECCHLHLG